MAELMQKSSESMAFTQIAFMHLSIVSKYIDLSESIHAESHTHINSLDNPPLSCYKLAYNSTHKDSEEDEYASKRRHRERWNGEIIARTPAPNGPQSCRAKDHSRLA